jgi:hypothetical protein
MRTRLLVHRGSAQAPIILENQRRQDHNEYLPVLPHSRWIEDGVHVLSEGGCGTGSWVHIANGSMSGCRAVYCNAQDQRMSFVAAKPLGERRSGTVVNRRCRIGGCTQMNGAIQVSSTIFR